MEKMQSVCAILLLSFASVLMGDQTTKVIKVTGKYAIISKGVNQGLREGMVLSVVRGSAQPDVVGKVTVIRATANRAAVRRLSGSRLALSKGDMLYSQRELDVMLGASGRMSSASTPPPPARAIRFEASGAPLSSSLASKQATQTRSTPATDPVTSVAGPGRVSEKLRNPWLSFTAGAIKPNGALALSSTSGTLVSGSYMVAMGPNVQMGLEVGQSFMGAPGGAATGSSFLSSGSSSLFSAMLVFQKFFGNYFFLEGGGGMFRPKITVNSLDGQKDSYSATHFGLVGGAGFFVPTSPYAGLVLKSRFQNYFDDSNKSYLAFSGGFRFKIR